MWLWAQWEPGYPKPSTDLLLLLTQNFDLILPSSLVDFLLEVTPSRFCWPVLGEKEPKLTVETHNTAEWDSMFPSSLLKCKAIFSSVTCSYFYHQKLSDATLAIDNWQWVLQFNSCPESIPKNCTETASQKANLGVTQLLTCPPIPFLAHTSSAGRTWNLNHVSKCPVLNMQ